jgi:hypothetical protein
VGSENPNGVVAMVKAFGAVSVLAFMVGLAYTLDCRSWSRSWDQASACYLTGGSLMGLGGIGKAAEGSWRAGFNTYNAALRDPRRDPALEPSGDPPIS